MKLIISHKILAKYQVFLMFLCLPFLVGQSDCQINQSLIQSLQQLQNRFKDKFQLAPGQNIYITQLSFMDTDTKSIMFQTEEAKLIIEAFLNFIKLAQKVNPDIKLNASGHTLKNTDATVHNLLDIIFDRNKTPEERINTIVSDIMEPNQVDMIVTGLYTDKGGPEPIFLRLLLIVKKEKKILTKHLKIDRRQFICSDPVDNGKKALCSSTYEEIVKGIVDILEALYIRTNKIDRFLKYDNLRI